MYFGQSVVTNQHYLYYYFLIYHIYIFKLTIPPQLEEHVVHVCEVVLIVENKKKVFAGGLEANLLVAYRQQWQFLRGHGNVFFSPKFNLCLFFFG